MKYEGLDQHRCTQQIAEGERYIVIASLAHDCYKVIVTRIGSDLVINSKTNIPHSECQEAHKNTYNNSVMNIEYINKYFYNILHYQPPNAIFESYDYPDVYDPLNDKPECKLSVTSQSSCGSCYMFGTTNVLRRKLCMIHGQYDIRLSEMNSLMCTSYNKAPCDGGGAAFTEISEIGGVVSESCSP